MTPLKAALEWAESNGGRENCYAEYVGALASSVRSLQSRVKALEQAIEDAPHGVACAWAMGVDPKPSCDCWKSRTKGGA